MVDDDSCEVDALILLKLWLHNLQYVQSIIVIFLLNFTTCLHTCDTVIPRYNAPRYNADLAITRFFTPKVLLPHLLR